MFAAGTEGLHSRLGVRHTSVQRDEEIVGHPSSCKLLQLHALLAHGSTSLPLVVLVPLLCLSRRHCTDTAVGTLWMSCTLCSSCRLQPRCRSACGSCFVLPRHHLQRQSRTRHCFRRFARLSLVALSCRLDFFMTRLSRRKMSLQLSLLRRHGLRRLKTTR
jgi:hypothetical protein